MGILETVWQQVPEPTKNLLSEYTAPEHRLLLIACVPTAAVATTLLIVAVYRLFFHPLRRIPGPCLARVSGLWRSKKYFDGRWHEDILKIHEKYGRVVRIAPNEISVVDEYAMKNLYGHGHNAPKTKWYSVWDPPNTAPQLFSELDKKNHAFLRRRVAAAYSMTSLLKYEKFIQDCLDLLLAKLKKHANLTGQVDMAIWTNAFAFDVVGELGYGQKLGHLETETDVGALRKGIFGVFKLLSNLGHFPGQMWIINGPMTWISAPSGRQDPLATFRLWSSEKVQHRIDTRATSKREDMLSHFMDLKKADGSPVSFEEVLIEAMNLM